MYVLVLILKFMEIYDVINDEWCKMVIET